MANAGEELGADLADLHHAGRHKLPTLAREFHTAASQLLYAGLSSPVFGRHPQLGGPVGTALAAMEVLQDRLVELTKQTATSLEDSGSVLTTAATVYAHTDTVAARTFEAMRDDIDAAYGVP